MVSQRFKNIKDTFSRNLKTMKESKRSGTGTDNIYKPKWHMFERLMFLKKTCAQANSVSNIPSMQLDAVTSNSIVNSLQSCDIVVEDSISNDISSYNIYYDEASQVSHLRITFIVISFLLRSFFLHSMNEYFYLRK
ncbi:hypothetical protein ALC57_08346 [Trachymyrmex cornetzi]|uniref:MADF domain-containing protein n=1 Tax=Trachymyrmex cornetzi TaxID=471704 RepID=A0A151J6Y9_9HYME|nr:hypothetical protein ALC57_08346 [Trachymyrmex cornetzi]